MPSIIKAMLCALIVFSCGMSALYIIVITAEQQPAPNSFDSMLCRVHVPLATKLITDELITCTNGKKYRKI
jgi:hypothetical protein